MRRIARSVSSLFLALLLSAPAARAQDSTAVRALAGHASTFDLVNGELKGPGADSLSSIARKYDFILVGEDHGIREVPQFVGALYALARPAGYAHLAVEIGPLSAKRLEKMMGAPNPRNEVVGFLHRYTPFTFPFFNWREEADLSERVVRETPGGRDVLWGLDQEFIVSPTYHFERLAELASTPAARTMATQYAKASAEGDRAMIDKGNPRAVWMASSSDEEVDRLREAFRPRPGSEADTILDEVAESRAIYRMFFAGQQYASNDRRTAWMKRHFAEWYAAARARGEREPRAIIKLGANHVFRGPSLTDTYEIGSFVPELALANGVKAFNMLVLVAHGTTNGYRPFGSALADTAQAYDPASSESEMAFTDVKSVVAAASPPHWTFFDLRPVRAAAQDGRIKGLDPKVRRLLVSFDAVIVVPEGHASGLLVGP